MYVDDVMTEVKEKCIRRVYTKKNIMKSQFADR